MDPKENINMDPKEKIKTLFKNPNPEGCVGCATISCGYYNYSFNAGTTCPCCVCLVKVMCDSACDKYWLNSPKKVIRKRQIPT